MLMRTPLLQIQPIEPSHKGLFATTRTTWLDINILNAVHYAAEIVAGLC
jgi:hypothetical protein